LYFLVIYFSICQGRKKTYFPPLLPSEKFFFLKTSLVKVYLSKSW